MTLFDSLFYRFATGFYRGDSSFGSWVMIAVSIMQFALGLPWFLFTLCWFVGTARAQHHQSVVFAAVVLLWLLCGWSNYRRYRNRFEALAERWRQEHWMTAGLKTLAS